MKTAVSLPDDIFKRVDRLAQRLKKSRSELYQTALVEFLARHEPDEITASWNDSGPTQEDRAAAAFVAEAARQTLARSEWNDD